MDYKNNVLTSFLNNNKEETNPLDKFDITFFAHILNQLFTSICVIYLNKNILPRRPNRCTYKFFYKRIKLWPNEKNYLYAEKILRVLSDAKE